MSFHRNLPRTAALIAGLVLHGPGGAGAAVQYELSVQPVEQSLAVTDAKNDAPPVLMDYFVDHANVRVGGNAAKTVFLFKAKTMTVIDMAQHSCHVLQRATTAQFLAHYADEVRLLRDAAARAPDEQRADAQHKAEVMQEISDRRQTPIQRDYKVTVRFNSVDGRACRIWEERENGAKRLEICVAPASRVPGGAEILAGMKTLSQFHEGGQFALGVDFGFTDWWPDFALLGGVPLMIHEFKYDSIVSEITLKAIRDDSPAPLSMDPPADCHVQDGPEFAQWYVR